MSASNTVSLITLFIVVSLLILLMAIYLCHERKKREKEAPSLRRKQEEEHQETAPSALLLTKRTLPHTTRKPFEETPNVTVDDFYNFKGARLLIVEDNRINQKIFQSVLQKSGILLTIANNGREALEYLYTPDREFDLVMMDINMPVMNGYDCTEKIRADHRFDTLPIITFTAFALGKEIERMYALGANGHMTKPLNSGRLYTVFNTYLSHIKRPVSTLSALKMKGLDVEAGIA
ncbi:MAG: response regulator, partial [Sulfurovum sp.]|nr:response regulator [Sulfurovum sp.]